MMKMIHKRVVNISKPNNVFHATNIRIVSISHDMESLFLHVKLVVSE